MGITGFSLNVPETKGTSTDPQIIELKYDSLFFSLYQSIIDHRSKLTAISGIDYATHLPGRINFSPPASVMEHWRNDYVSMQSGMIYGASLPFEKLIERIKELNERFRTIKIDADSF